MTPESAPIDRVSRKPERPGHRYTADTVFDALAAEILRGELAPGSLLPPERALSERFGASKLLVRQAIHRLAEADLVDVRQGSATRVGNPEEASGLQVLELYYRLAPHSRATCGLARDVLEKQFTQGLSLVEIFSRRATAADREALVALVEAGEAAQRNEGAFTALEASFWSTVARGANNRVLLAEVRWWYTALVARPSMPRPPPLGARYGFYLELARRLRDRTAPLTFYLDTLTPAINALFATDAPRKPGRVSKKQGRRS